MARTLRPLAFLDIETTGLEEDVHETIELAIVVVDPRTLHPRSQFDVRIRPEHIERATPRALEVSGYTSDGWINALEPRAALMDAAPFLEGCTIAGHNVSGFDLPFLRAAFKRADLAFPAVDYHIVDTVSLAWPLVVSGEVESLSLDALAKLFAIERPSPHRALADVLVTMEVARRLVDRMTRQPDNW